MFEFVDLAFKVYIVCYSVVAIVHFVGLVLLCKSKSNLPNQRLLLMNLGAVEMLFSFYVVIAIMVWLNVNETMTFTYVDSFFSALFYTEIRLTIMHIIYDRFLDILTNIKYPLYMTAKKIRLLIVIRFTISAMSAIIAIVLQTSDKGLVSEKFTFLLPLTLDISILISATATYIYFFVTVRKIREIEARDAGQPQESRSKLLIKKFKLPCYIVMTYMLFNLTGAIMFTASRYVENQRRSKLLSVFAHLPIIVGFTSDACIYVFANKNVRKLFCTTCKRRNIRVSDQGIDEHL